MPIINKYNAGFIMPFLILTGIFCFYKPAVFNISSCVFFVFMFCPYIYAVCVCTGLIFKSKKEKNFFKFAGETFLNINAANSEAMDVATEFMAKLKSCVITGYEKLETFAYITQILNRFLQTGSISSVSGHTEYLAGFNREKLSNKFIWVKYIGWAIPTLGFMGTVWGISKGITGFSEIIKTEVGDSMLIAITNSFGMAFNTTFCAFALSIALKLYISKCEKVKEKELLDVEHFFVDELLINLIEKLENEVKEGRSIPEKSSESQNGLLSNIISQFTKLNANISKALESTAPVQEPFEKSGGNINDGFSEIGKNMEALMGRLLTAVESMDANLNNSGQMVENNLKDFRKDVYQAFSNFKGVINVDEMAEKLGNKINKIVNGIKKHPEINQISKKIDDVNNSLTLLKSIDANTGEIKGKIDNNSALESLKNIHNLIERADYALIAENISYIQTLCGKMLEELKNGSSIGGIDDLVKEVPGLCRSIRNDINEIAKKVDNIASTEKLDRLIELVKKPLTVLLNRKEMTGIVDDISVNIRHELQKLICIDEKTDIQQTVFDEIKAILDTIENRITRYKNHDGEGKQTVKSIERIAGEMNVKLDSVEKTIPKDWRELVNVISAKTIEETIKIVGINRSMEESRTPNQENV